MLLSFSLSGEPRSNRALRLSPSDGIALLATQTQAPSRIPLLSLAGATLSCMHADTGAIVTLAMLAAGADSLLVRFGVRCQTDNCLLPVARLAARTSLVGSSQERSPCTEAAPAHQNAREPERGSLTTSFEFQVKRVRAHSLERKRSLALHVLLVDLCGAIRSLTCATCSSRMTSAAGSTRSASDLLHSAPDCRCYHARHRRRRRRSRMCGRWLRCAAAASDQRH